MNNNIIINENILNYWYITEFLNQPKYPYFDQTTNNGKSAIVGHHFENGEDIHCLIQQDNKSMRTLPVLSSTIDVCLGKVSRDECVRAIYKLSNQSDNRIEKTYGTIAVMGMQISTLKRYVPHSFNISPIIWAIYKLSNSTNCNLYQLINEESYQNDLIQIENMLIEQEEINMNVLYKCFDEMKKTFIKPNILSELAFLGCFVYQRFESETIMEKNEDLLNYATLSMSFFTSDLNLAKKLNAEKLFSTMKMGKDFIEPYISCKSKLNKDVSNRIDLLENTKQTKSAIERILHIDNMPLGKWPSRFSSSFMQQVAINLSISLHHEFPSNISVNGPPGTGKTTLLKEIIADSVVKKAMVMSKYENSNDAFTKCDFKEGDNVNNGYNKFFSHYYKVCDELNQFSILVASCNNTAVENITKELPNGENLCKGLHSKITKTKNEQELEKVYNLFKQQENDIYYTKYAFDFFNKKDKNQYYWGLISAPLGNKSNQGSFTYMLSKLFKEEISKNEFLDAHKIKYTKAVLDFQQQLDLVLKLKKELEKACNTGTKLENEISEIEKRKLSIYQSTENANKKIKGLNDILNKATIELNMHTSQMNEEIENLEILNKKIDATKELLDTCLNVEAAKKEAIVNLENSRNFKDIILAVFRVESYKNTNLKIMYQELLDNENTKINVQSEINEITENIKIVHIRITEYEKEIKKIQDFIVDNQKEILELEMEITENDKKIETSEKLSEMIKIEYDKWQKTREMKNSEYDSFERLNESFYSDLFNDSDIKTKIDAHLKTPWISEHYNREREILFYKALQVNKEFILSSSNVRANLKNLLMMWTGKDGENPVKFKDSDRKEAYVSLYQTISVLIPVISTTFASVGRFFNDIQIPYQLGTLIIDEAGQAPPHMAIGSMLRCRKTIIVGDPKQIEPVVTDDSDALRKLLKNEITVPYTNKRLSVQQFADELNPFGTYYDESYGGSTWVGCPLVIHRRCIEPMFSISNAISYDGKMMQQTDQPNSDVEKKFALTFSQWIPCKGKENSNLNKDHFVEAQGEICLKIIESAFNKSSNNQPDIFIISPFTTVVNGMKKKIKSSKLYSRNTKIIQEWMGKSIGTVHTFQGKEANEVIFLLGCDQDSTNAIKWVNANIINVAVTRAKFRLCIIGDYQIWKENEYFKIAKEIIDVYTINKLDELNNMEVTADNLKQAKLLSQRLPTSTDYIIENENISQINVMGFMKRLSKSGLKATSLTELEMKEYQLNESDINNLSFSVKSHLIAAIKINSIYELFMNAFQLEFSDKSFKNILLCKATEIHIRESFKDTLKMYFKSANIGRKKIEVAKDIDFTLKASATCIESLAEEIASLMHASQYSYDWWISFSNKLKEVGSLRNECCHTGDFSRDDESRLKHLLFEEHVFLDISIGKILKDAIKE